MSSLRKMAYEIQGSVHNEAPRYAVIHDERGRILGVYFNAQSIPPELHMSPTIRHKHYKLSPQESTQETP